MCSTGKMPKKNPGIGKILESVHYYTDIKIGMWPADLHKTKLAATT